MAPSPLLLVVVFLLVLVNAFFVAAEFALAKVRSTRVASIARDGGWRGRALVTAQAHLDTFLSATQLGITLTSLGLGWLAGPTFVRLLEPILGRFGSESPAVIHNVGVAAAFTLIAFLHLVLGELVPRSYAIRAPERVALMVALPMRVFQIVLRPALWLLDRTAIGTLRLLGVQPENGGEHAHSEEELRILLAESHRHGALTGPKRELLENVIDYTGRTARHVMIPRADIAYLSLAQPLERNLTVVTESTNTRFPLVTTDIDHVVGMVHVKDLFNRRDQLRSSQDLEAVKREILFVPETRPLDALQKDFQQRRTHMAIVVDEYGATAGLVTLEDVIEEIVGEIQDEFDREPPQVEETPQGLVFDGLTLIDDASDRLGVALPAAGDVSTLGGLMTARIGRIPRVGDTVAIGGWIFKVNEIRARRVTKVLATPRQGGRADVAQRG